MAAPIKPASEKQSAYGILVGRDWFVRVKRGVVLSAPELASAKLFPPSDNSASECAAKLRELTVSPVVVVVVELTWPSRPNRWRP